MSPGSLSTRVRGRSTVPLATGDPRILPTSMSPRRPATLSLTFPGPSISACRCGQSAYIGGPTLADRGSHVPPTRTKRVAIFQGMFNSEQLSLTSTNDTPFPFLRSCGCDSALNMRAYYTPSSVDRFVMPWNCVN